MEQKIEAIEGEMALVKGEIKQTLVDLREFIMKQGSPFMVGGGDGEGGGVAQGALDQMLEQAQAVAREETTVNLQRGLEELHRENQRQLEAIQAQITMGPGGGTEDLMAEIEDLRRQSQQQAATSQRQMDALQAAGGGGADTAELRRQMDAIQADQAAGGGGADTAELRRQMEAMRADSERQIRELQTQQSTTGDPAAAANLQRQMDDMRREQQHQMDAMQAQSAAQAVQPPVLGAQVIAPPAGAPPQAQVIQVQPAPAQLAVEQPVEQPAQQMQATPQVLQVETETPLAVEPAPVAPVPAVMPAVSTEVVGQPVQPVALDVAVQQEEFIAAPVPQMATPVGMPDQPLPPEMPAVFATESAPSPAAPYAEPVSPLAEQLQGNSSLDANLLASLIRWVGGLKRRMGAEQLPGFIEMYKLTGHLPPVVERLVLHVATLEALPDESEDQIFTLDDVMDSLLQLHAIIYGPGHAVRGSLAGLLEEQSEDA